jgi:NitT/TauT family transport system ATP-binding protein
VVLEKSLPPPRGARSREAIAAVGDEMRRLMAQATTEAGRV